MYRFRYMSNDSTHAPTRKTDEDSREEDIVLGAEIALSTVERIHERATAG